MGIFNGLVKVANLIESSFLWIHEIELKMVRAWPAWSARLFSTDLSRLFPHFPLNQHR